MSTALPETVDGRSLLFAVLITGVVAATAGTGLYRGPVEVLAVLPLIAVVWAGVYRPVARRIPYRDQLVGVAFLPIGVYRLTTDWPSILGGLFVLLAVVAIGQIARQEFQGARSRGA